MAATCRSCNARIRWAETQNGKKVPLDDAPSPDGNIVINERGQAVYLKGGETSSRSRFISHFKTCPNASDHSKGRSSGPSSSSRRGGPRGGSSPSDMVDVVRDTAWRIKTGEEPVITAHAVLFAAVQVLVEHGKSIDEIKDAVARASEMVA